MTAPAASVIEGGLWHRIMLLLRLEREPDPLAPRRAAVMVGLTWLPLLVLTALDGTASGGVAIPFLYDIAVHARCLIAIPVMILGEPILAGRLRPAVDQFRSAGLVGEDAAPVFDAALAELRRRVQMPWPELGLLVFALAMPWVLHTRIGLEVESSTWRARAGAGGLSLTPAGEWLRLVSVPLSLFLALRWLWWLGLWSGFLRRVARSPLHVVPGHPDGHGGVGFLASAQTAWIPLIFALSVVLGGATGVRILFGGHALPDYYPLLGSFVAFAVAIPLAPLIVFAPRLAVAKRRALFAYGRVASHTGRRFEEKWLGQAGTESGALLEEGDVSTLCDFGDVFERVQKLSPIPIGRDGLVPLMAAALLPLLPLSLAVWPLDVIVKQLVGILF
jgi:hypothetical protein